jgi:hypothetical protein
VKGALPPSLPWWRFDQRPRSWVPLGAVALVILTVAGEDTSATCSAVRPCGPDWIGSVLFGLLLASAAAIFVHRWTAALLAIVMLALWLLGEQVSPSHPWWVQLGVLGYTALCVRVASAERLEPAPPALTLPVPAPVGARPRLGRGWRLVAAGLVLGAGGITWGTVAQQQRVQAQEDAAQLVQARVTKQVNPSTIAVRIEDGDKDIRVGVLDSRAYPVGSSLGFLVDGAGLHQPVSEPYDITGVIVFAGLAAGLAIAALARAHRYESALRGFLSHPQPARLVRIIDADGIIAVFPFEPASELDPPYLVYQAVRARGVSALRPAPVLSDPDDEPLQDDPAQAPVVATLYGVDRPGHWCAAEVDGVLLTPARAAKAGPGPAVEPESLDSPVDAAELWPGDQAVSFDVRTHRHHPAGGVIQALGLGGGLVLVFDRFLSLGTVGLLVLVTAVLAISSEFCWRVLLRPRVLWHGAGLAVLTPFGGFNGRWDDVAQVSAGKDDVTIIVDGVGGGIVPTRRRLPHWLPERTARELALALRHTRQHSLLGEPPPVPVAHRPAGLYLACAALVPVLVLFIRWAG